MSSEPAAGAPAERRLHPWSWLFVLLTNLRHVALPAIVLLVFGQGETWELMGAVAAVVLAVHSVIYSFGFRWRIADGELVIREGIFDRTERHLPFARIQNVSQRRNILHRLFKVTELRIESAGGGEPEAKMAVIALAEAESLEALLRGRVHAAGETVQADGAAALAPRALLRLGVGELVRLGIASNRGLVVVAAAFGAAWQGGRDPRELPVVRDLWDWAERFLGGWIQGHGPAEIAVSAAVLLLFAMLALRVLSVLLALFRHWGFVLERDGRRVATEEGLLTRVRAGAAVDRIQRVRVEESLLMRLMQRQALRIDVAGGIAVDGDDRGQRLRWLAPIATPPTVSALVDELVPALAIGDARWRPLHPRAWRRLATTPAVLLSIAAAVVAMLRGGPADPAFPLLVAVWAGGLVLILLHARGWARWAAYAHSGASLAFREGWLSRRWTTIELARIQAVGVEAGPLDRWAGMATLAVDVAGTPAGSASIAIPYLPRAEAEALHARLARAVSTHAGPDAGDPAIGATTG
jgi:putative membrane protein